MLKFVWIPFCLVVGIEQFTLSIPCFSTITSFDYFDFLYLVSILKFLRSKTFWTS